MKEQHNQKKLSIYVTLLIVVICLFGISFALFKFNASQATQNDITTLNCFEIEYSDVTDAITIANDFPISDADGLERSPYTFKIKNKCSQLLNIQIGVETLTTSQIQPNLIKGVITNKGETPTSAKLLSAGIPGTPVNGGTNYILLEDTILANQEKEYDLRLWFTESMTKEQGSGKTYQGKVTVISSPKTEEPVQFLTAIMRDNTVTETLTQPGKEISAYTLDDIVDTSTQNVSSTYQAYYITYGSGWEANGTKFNLTGTAVTSDTYANSYSSLVGKYLIAYYISGTGSSTAGKMKTTTNLSSVYYVVSATQNSFTYKQITSNKNMTEALLASTEDDYGTSYYFRGAVTNNYVEFANKCWRIVRVGGDGSVKLILHNDNTAGAANPCNSANNSTSAAFARYSGTTYESAFNTNYNDNAYVGFKYGTAGASDYATTHANTNKSTILTNLETWYNNNLKTYESVIDNSVWCNDKTNVTDTSYDPINITPTGSGYAENVTYYGATQRLVSTSGSAGGTGPSLKCNGELSKITSKVGLITADELAFAGYAYNIGNTTTYLQENATDTYWWSLSPNVFYSGSARVWGVFGSGGYFEYYGVLSTNGVRPSISLKSTTNVTGNGTSDTPYKIVS